jgi:hypothetical protein
MASSRVSRSRAVTAVTDSVDVAAERSTVAEAAPARTGYYPVGCPHCQQIAGMSVAVNTTAMKSSFVVELLCSTCHHRWVEEVSRT